MWCVQHIAQILARDHNRKAWISQDHTGADEQVYTSVFDCHEGPHKASSAAMSIFRSKQLVEPSPFCHGIANIIMRNSLRSVLRHRATDALT